MKLCSYKNQPHCWIIVNHDVLKTYMDFFFNHRNNVWKLLLHALRWLLHIDPFKDKKIVYLKNTVKCKLCCFFYLLSIIQTQSVKHTRHMVCSWPYKVNSGLLKSIWVFLYSRPTWNLLTAHYFLLGQLQTMSLIVLLDRKTNYQWKIK